MEDTRSQGGTFVIEGGHRLQGTIIPQGAKNEALQILCATLLTTEEVVVYNLPDIDDVNNLIAILQQMGVEVNRQQDGGWSFRAQMLDEEFLSSPQYITRSASLRGSIMLAGPLLARLGKALVPRPGGDRIGRRRLDTHFQGFLDLGAQLHYDTQANLSILQADRLQGCYMLLDEASVTGTANILMAAVLAQGRTIIYNAACEPYVQQLCRLLVKMGARISGIGSNLLTVDGVDQLHGATHSLQPDMIEVGSFIGMAAITRSELTIKGTSAADLGIIPNQFRRLGIRIEQRGEDLYIPEHDHYEIDTFMDGSILTLADAPWPGLTPDLLSVMLVVATQAKGTVLIHQKMFESRLFFVDRLIEMGAQIILCDPHRAVVVGNDHQKPLHAGRMASPDIRAGIAMLIAAMSAEGVSEISNIQQIDRGYQHIEQRLNALGAKIHRR
ncbi:MAG: UDP-N-acetylglucosamine 1-carboxyvinyltransferase [Bacteroides sp.]